MPLYEQNWFIKFITWCRKWGWFDKYIYGKSLNIEDFTRNPAEVLRDTYFPFVIQNVKAYSILLRCGFIPYTKERENDYYNDILDFKKIDSLPESVKNTYKKYYDGKTLGFNSGKWRIVDLAATKWITKYPNAGFMFQILISMKYKVIPIPFIAMGIRYSKCKYFQFGFGWSPQWKNYLGKYPGDTSVTAVFSAKFRLADYSDELAWNPGSEVFGYYEGNV